MKTISNHKGGRTRYSDETGYKSINTKVYSVWRNYLNVVDLEYYIPVEIEKDLPLPKLANGDLDVVQALYDDSNLHPSADGTKDPHKVVKDNWPSSNSETKNVTQGIKVLVPEGFRMPMSLSTAR